MGRVVHYMDMIVQPMYDAVMVEKSRLADVLERWQQEQRLEWSQLARMAGISRGTINNIRHGNAVHSDSLRKLAKGLATHPNTGAFDPSVHTRALRDLFEAGGFIVAPEYPARDLRAMIAEVLGPERAAPKRHGGLACRQGPHRSPGRSPDTTLNTCSIRYARVRWQPDDLRLPPEGLPGAGAAILLHV